MHAASRYPDQARNTYSAHSHHDPTWGHGRSCLGGEAAAGGRRVTQALSVECHDRHVLKELVKHILLTTAEEVIIVVVIIYLEA